MGPGLVLTMPFAILHGYFDDSGKLQDQNIIALCGWISHLLDWEKFAEQWHAALERHNISDFHMAKLKGQDAVLEDFVGIIKRNSNVLCGVGAAINTQVYRAMPQVFRNKAGHPHFLAFSTIVKLAIDRIEAFAREVGFGDEVFLALIFDQDEQLSQECFKLLNKLKKIDERVRKRVTGLCFCNRRQVYPLQAADMIAYETRAEIDRRINRPQEPVSKIFAAMTTKDPSGKPDGFYNGIIYDRKELERTARLLGISI
jgi:hypothetical protein